MKNFLFCIFFCFFLQVIPAQSTKLIDSLSNIYEVIIYYKNTPFLEVVKKGKYRFEKPNIKTEYDYVSTDNLNGMYFCPAQKNNYWGLLDSTGKEIGRWDYDEITIYNYLSPYFECKKNGKIGIINVQGKEILPPQYDDIEYKRFGYLIESDSKIGFADFNGNIRIPIEYKPAYIDAKSHLILHKDSLTSIWKLPEYEKIIGEIYTDVKHTHHGFIVTKNGKKGIIDTLGKVLVPIEQIDIENDGYGNYLICKKRVKQKKHASQLMQKQEEETVLWGTNISSNMTACENDSLIVESWGLYDIKGKEILPPIYEKIVRFDTNTAITTIDQKVGMIDLNGNIILPYVFDDIKKQNYASDFIFAYKDRKNFIYNQKGKLLADDILFYTCVESKGKNYVWVHRVNSPSSLVDNEGVIKQYKMNIGGVNNHIIGKKGNKRYLLTPQRKTYIPEGYELHSDEWLYPFYIFNKWDKSTIQKSYIILNEEGKKILTIPHIQDWNCNAFGMASIRKNNKEALYDLKKGKQITHFRFASIDISEDTSQIFCVKTLDGSSYYINKKGKKVSNPQPKKIVFKEISPNTTRGLIDTFGQTLLPPIYEKVRVYTKFIVGEENPARHTILDYKGQNIYKDYLFYQPHGKNIILKDTLGKFGIVNKDDKVVIPFLYDALKNYENAYIAKKNKKWGTISMNGKTNIPFRYQKIWNRGDNVYFVMKNRKWRIIDSLGRASSAQKYDSIFTPFVYLTDFTIVKKNNKSGIVKRDGTLITPMLLSSEFIERDEYPYFIQIRNNEKVSYVNSKGVVSPQYDDIINNEFWLSYRVNGLYGLMDFDFQEVLPPHFEEIYIHNNHHIILKKTNHQCIYFSVANKKIVSEEFAILKHLNHPNIIAFSKDSVLYGLIDTTGKVIVPPKFEQIGYFFKNKLVVQLNGKSGIIDDQGNWVLAPEYAALGMMVNGYTILKEDCKYRLISPEGQFISEEYDMIDEVKASSANNEALFLATKEGKLIYLDSTGKALAPCIFDFIIRKENHYLIVSKNDKIGVWDIQKQKMIIPYQYYDIEYIGQYQDNAYFGVGSHYMQYGIMNDKNELIHPFIYGKIGNNTGKFYKKNNIYIFNPKTEQMDLNLKGRIFIQKCIDANE